MTDKKEPTIVPDDANMSDLRGHGKKKTRRKLSDRENLLILREKHDAMVAGIKVMNRESIELRNRILFLETSLANAQTSVDINKKIMISELTRFNIEKQDLNKRIIQLKLRQVTGD